MWTIVFGVTAAWASEPSNVRIGPGEGVTVTSPDDRASLTLRGRTLLRASFFDDPLTEDPGARWTTSAQVRTARLHLSGHLYSKRLQYVQQYAFSATDYRDGAVSPLYDSYLELRAHPSAIVRVGQGFVPFDRARTVREFALQLPERPHVVSELTLDRDVGVTLGSDPRALLAYRMGVYGGAGIGQTRGVPPGALLVARAEVRPLGPIDDDEEGDLSRREQPGLALGVGAAVNLATTRTRSTTGPSFPSGVATYRHLAADLVGKWRGASLLAEGLVRDAAQASVRGDDGTETPAREAWGGFVQPAYTFDGHWEVVGRWGRLVPFDGTDPALLPVEEIALGVNRYVSGHRLKVQLGGHGLREHAGAPVSVATHLQVDATF